MDASLKLNILTDTDNYLAIHKPSGIHSVKTAKSTNLSIVDILPDELRRFQNSSPSPLDGGIVNRLDFETSGVLIIAKSRDSWEYLHNQYKNGRVNKEYLCIVEPSTNFSAHPSLNKNSQIHLEGYLGSSSRSSTKMRWFNAAPATKYRARSVSLTIYPIVNLNSTELLIKVVTKHGIRHQIRAACSAFASPLIGDNLYGSNLTLQCLPLPSFFLHSQSVDFTDQRGIRIRLESNILPQTILEAIKS